MIEKFKMYGACASYRQILFVKNAIKGEIQSKMIQNPLSGVHIKF